MDLVERNLLQTVSEADPFTEERYRQFMAWLPAGCRDVLDVGCNTGRGGRVLKQLRPALRLRGMDIVQSRLDRLPAQVYDGTVCGSATAMPLADGSQDAIVAGEFIEHLDPPDAQRFLHEAFRVLALGGVLLLTTPNPSDLKRRLRGGTILGGAHVSQHHAEALALQLRMAGFGRVTVRGSGKVSRWLGPRFPWLAVYGSYLVCARKY
jgi:SAM-dependent methyltransferase